MAEKTGKTGAVSLDELTDDWHQAKTFKVNVSSEISSQIDALESAGFKSGRLVSALLTREVPRLYKEALKAGKITPNTSVKPATA